MSKVTKLVRNPVRYYKDSRYKRQCLFLLLPVLIVTLYLFVFSVEKYQSSAIYLIKDNGSKPKLGFDLGIFGASSSSHRQDSSILEAYLCSFDTLTQVDKAFQLTELYHSSQADILDRLTPFSTRDDLLALYRKNLSVFHNDLTGLTTLSFLDSNPERAQRIVTYLLKHGEDFLNTLNRNSAEKKIAFLQEQLQVNEMKMTAAIDRVESFQNSHHLLDPKVDMQVQQSIIANLEGLRVEKRAERNQLRNFMREDAIEIVRLNHQITEIESSLKATRLKLSGGDQERLNDLMFQFEKLKVDVDFASKVYRETLVQYEVGKMEALQEAKVLEVITTPTRPDEYIWPDKPKTLGTLIFLILLFYKIGQLTLAVVMDHRD